MVKILSLDRPNTPPLELSDRFRKEVVYFMTPTDQEMRDEMAHSPGDPSDKNGDMSIPTIDRSKEVPKCGPNEYWIRLEDSKRWLDDGGFTLVSPLDAESVAEIELSEDQERWLEWMIEHQVSHIRLV